MSDVVDGAVSGIARLKLKASVNNKGATSGVKGRGCGWQGSPAKAGLCRANYR